MSFASRESSSVGSTRGFLGKSHAVTIVVLDRISGPWSLERVAEERNPFSAREQETQPASTNAEAKTSPRLLIGQ
jgi:hypothetical protein